MKRIVSEGAIVKTAACIISIVVRYCTKDLHIRKKCIEKHMEYIVWSCSEDMIFKEKQKRKVVKKKRIAGFFKTKINNKAQRIIK